MTVNFSADARPNLDGPERAAIARNRRTEATKIAFDQSVRPSPVVPSNGDNAKYASLPMAFTKGLLHDAFGVVDPAAVKALATVLTDVGGMADKPRRDMAEVAPYTASSAYGKWADAKYPKDGRLVSCLKVGQTSKDVEFRAWESPLAGLYYTDEGPDPAGVAMAPAPKFGESELTAEMAELYAMALVRDVPFADLAKPETELTYRDETGKTVSFTTAAGTPATVKDLIDALNELPWFGNGPTIPATEHERRRRSARFAEGKTSLDVESLFRGSSPGAKKGDYLSRFLTRGTVPRNLQLKGKTDAEKDVEKAAERLKGIIQFGAQTVDQRVQVAKPGLDYMTSWAEWRDVQNGVDLRGTDYFLDEKDPTPLRIISTPRDLATYVHFDQLYQAYFNACLMLLETGAAFDTGFPDQRKHALRAPFAAFGGPHILSLLTEVASRGLKAVRREKYQIHRRARPERLGALIELAASDYKGKLGDAQPQAASMLQELGVGANPSHHSKIADIMKWVRLHNAGQNGKWAVDMRKYTCEPLLGLPDVKAANYLLPMAFPEGSPMHPAYGAGHATVAGACVTILKAFFEMSNATVKGDAHIALINGDLRTMANITGDAGLTLEGELNKLAANIAIGRNLAGVHYYTDYYDSVRMGERVAFGILQEQMLNYNEEVSMTFRSFDGDTITIWTNGGRRASDVMVRITDVTNSDIPLATWWNRHVAEFAGPVDHTFVDITPVSNWTQSSAA